MTVTITKRANLNHGRYAAGISFNNMLSIQHIYMNDMLALSRFIVAWKKVNIRAIIKIA